MNLPHFRRPQWDEKTGDLLRFGPPEPATIASQGNIFGDPDPVVRFERDGALYPLAQVRHVPVNRQLFEEA